MPHTAQLTPVQPATLRPHSRLHAALLSPGSLLQCALFPGWSSAACLLAPSSLHSSSRSGQTPAPNHRAKQHRRPTARPNSSHVCIYMITGLLVTAGLHQATDPRGGAGTLVVFVPCCAQSLEQCPAHRPISIKDWLNKWQCRLVTPVTGKTSSAQVSTLHSS